MKPITKNDYVTDTIGKPSILTFHENYAEQAELNFLVKVHCMSDVVFTTVTKTFPLNEGDFRLILSAISSEHPEYHFTVVSASSSRGPKLSLYCNNFKVTELDYNFIEGCMRHLNIDGSVTYKGAA